MRVLYVPCQFEGNRSSKAINLCLVHRPQLVQSQFHRHLFLVTFAAALILGPLEAQPLVSWNFHLFVIDVSPIRPVYFSGSVLLAALFRMDVVIMGDAKDLSINI